MKKDGFPNLSLIIDMSFKFSPSLKPVPSDLTKASFAANLLAKYEVLFFIFFEIKISLFVNTLFKKELFVIYFFILEFSTISTPVPIIFIN